MEVLLQWEEDHDGGLRVARASWKLLGRACFAWLGEVGHCEDQEKVKELKETTFPLRVNGLRVNGSRGNGSLESVAWNGQENACLRAASLIGASESSETASGGTGKPSGPSPSRSPRWRSSASCCSSSAARPSPGWRRSSGAAATSPSGG